VPSRSLCLSNSPPLSLPPSLHSYQPLLAAARKFQENKSEEQFRETSSEIQACMPAEHSCTLSHLLRFLCEVEANSEANSMDAENLSRIFAPTIMWSREEAAAAAPAAAGAAGAGAGAGAAAAMQQDLMRAATELNLCKIVVAQLLKQHAAAVAAAAGAGRSGDAGGRGQSTASGEEGPALDPKVLSRLQAGRFRGGGGGGGGGEGGRS